MSSPTQQDINVRLQLAGQAYACLVNLYANDLKFGRKCNNEQNLFLLNAYLETIEQYKIGAEEITINTILSSGTFTVNSVLLSDGFITIIYFDGINPGVNISTYTWVATVHNTDTLATVIAEQLTIDGYPSTAFNNIITIINMPCDNLGGFGYTALGATGVGSVLSGGICASYTPAEIVLNCLTEDNLNTIFNNISKLTKICFQSYGYTYS